MCTLILGVEVLGPNTLLVGANRDESPERPAAGPDVLVDAPRVVGGRDLLAGGTWLAVREDRFVAALMNRRPDPAERRDPTTFRSRGLLCLDTAAAPGHSFLGGALESLHRHAYGPCTLVGVGVDGEAWWIRSGQNGSIPVARPVARGWHVITHADLDDPAEPRTRAVLDALGDRIPAGVDAAVDRLSGLLRGHGPGGTPSVCLHGERVPTVSSSILALGALGALGAPRYVHAAGPPCTTPYEDCSALLSPGQAPGARAADRGE
jgi:Transport and Golgi organisation 2